MSYGEISLRFQGFHPSEFTQTFLESEMKEIHEESPNGSFLRATFTRQNKIFKGIVRVSSSAGTFFAKATGTRLKDVDGLLVQQMRRQLDRWKTVRMRRQPKLVVETIE